MIGLKPIWPEIEWYIDNGFSVIPCYDQNATDKSQIKKPCIKSWKPYQSEIIGKEELFKLMDEKNTSAIAIITGKVSGNLEVIDIDVKNWAGIDTLYFLQIKELYQPLWNKLRIHRTPSGGYHIPYRIKDREPGRNEKLCKKTDQKGVAIETRGEGGYVLAPPSVGYTIFKNEPFPVLTWEEREALFALAKHLSEDIAPAKVRGVPSQKSKEFSHYKESPFDHFNRSLQGERILEQYGWKFLKRVGDRLHFQRPNQPAKGQTGATFNLVLKKFYFFTTSSEFEAERYYSPSEVLTLLECQGDWKKSYKWLTENKFGHLKPEVEKQLARDLITKGKDLGAALPRNFSPEGIKYAIDRQGALVDAHPYGIFWFEDKEDREKYTIERTKLLEVASGLGFRVWNKNLVRIVDDNYIEDAIDERYFFDEIKKYIRDDGEGDQNKVIAIHTAYSSFMERHMKFIIETLPILLDESILQDGKDVCYKFYQNCYIQITAYDIEEHQYDELEKMVWKKNVQPRNWPGLTVPPSGKYVDYLQLAIVGGITQYLKNIVGYLAHEHKDETTGYIITLTEECDNPEDGGGSGKNVFCNLFRYTTTLASKPGSQVKFDEKFLQSWNYEKIFVISDALKNFEFGFLKELSTGSALVKKLFKNEFEVASEYMPKFVVQTNYSYEIKDGGLRRRIIPLEFTNFFTIAGGIDAHFNAHFPKGWSHEDWAGYDRFLADSVKTWLASGRKLRAVSLTETGWTKQFKMNFGDTLYNFLDEHHQKFLEVGFLSDEDFKNVLERFYVMNAVQPRYQPAMHRVNMAMASFFTKIGYHFDHRKNRKKNGIIERGKAFGPSIEAPF
jgi:hypothetical protein